MAKKPAKIARKSTAKSKPKSAHRKAATRKPVARKPARKASPRKPSGPGSGIHPVYRLPRTMTTQARVCFVSSSRMLPVAPPVR